MISEDDVLQALGQQINDNVPALAGRVIKGPFVEAPTELTCCVQYGTIDVQWDGMEVAYHQLIVMVGMAWQPGAPYYPVHMMLSEVNRAVYDSIKLGIGIGPNDDLIVTGPFLITPPTVGLEQPAGISNIAWASVTMTGETKEGLSNVEQ
jgi:hypothetical protein